jgi:hypothetical protein
MNVLFACWIPRCLFFTLHHSTSSPLPTSPSPALLFLIFLYISYSLFFLYLSLQRLQKSEAIAEKCVHSPSYLPSPYCSTKFHFRHQTWANALERKLLKDCKYLFSIGVGTAAAAAAGYALMLLSLLLSLTASTIFRHFILSLFAHAELPPTLPPPSHSLPPSIVCLCRRRCHVIGAVLVTRVGRSAVFEIS